MKVLFIAIGNSTVAWYRCALPANYLDHDWIGVVGNDPDDLTYLSGNIEDDPVFEDYDVIVVQQVSGQLWLNKIKEWQAKGIKVVYEIDDFIHGVHKIESHIYKDKYAKAMVKKNFVPCFEAADAMICSTQFLSDQYKKYNPNQHVCLVGIDTARYNVEFPEREELIIGWAGGTGHHNSVGPWLEEVSKIIALYDNVAFISIGTRYGDAIAQRHSGKGLSVPWTSVENYPYALTNIDIAIAPAHDSKYYLSKSDLRWLEASAVGIPTVANPSIYKEIDNEKTGLTAEIPEDAGDSVMELIEDKELRKEIASNAQTYVQEHRDISKAIEQWGSAFTEIVK